MKKIMLGFILTLVAGSSSAACVFNEYGSYCHELIPNYNGSGWAYLPATLAPSFFNTLQQAIYVNLLQAGYSQEQLENQQGKSMREFNENKQSPPPNVTQNFYTITGNDIQNNNGGRDNKNTMDNQK